MSRSPITILFNSFSIQLMILSFQSQILGTKVPNRGQGQGHTKSRVLSSQTQTKRANYTQQLLRNVSYDNCILSINFSDSFLSLGLLKDFCDFLLGTYFSASFVSFSYNKIDMFIYSR